jgi:hypothetical protein
MFYDKKHPLEDRTKEDPWWLLKDVIPSGQRRAKARCDMTNEDETPMFEAIPVQFWFVFLACSFCVDSNQILTHNSRCSMVDLDAEANSNLDILAASRKSQARWVRSDAFRSVPARSAKWNMHWLSPLTFRWMSQVGYEQRAVFSDGIGWLVWVKGIGRVRATSEQIEFEEQGYQDTSGDCGAEDIGHERNVCKVSHFLCCVIERRKVKSSHSTANNTEDMPQYTTLLDD